MGPSGEQLILAVDTATQTRSVAVARGPRLLALKAGREANTHSANVLAEIDDALRGAGVSVREIELFACASGPGSFTGLRAGLATLKAFAATLGRPAVGVPTLRAVARAACEQGQARASREHADAPDDSETSAPARVATARVVAMLPAGRGEVFAQTFSVSDDSRIVELDEAAHVAPPALVERVLRGHPDASFDSGASVPGDSAGLLVWAGGGAHLHAELLRAAAESAGVRWLAESDNAGEGDGASSNADAHQHGASVWRLAPPAPVLAAHVAALGLEVFRSGGAGDASGLQAIYVRPSDAEINERCRAQEQTTK